MDTINQRGIYQDLMRKFVKESFNVFIVSPVERREGKRTSLKREDGVNYLYVKTFNLQKTNIIEKGIGTIAIEYQFLNAIKKHFPNIKFDIVLYSTPPITFSKIIQFIKKRDRALSYLLLKDIFPQNAVDLKMMKVHGLLHNIFLKKEKELYGVSDYIGCMSKANVEYVLKHNPKVTSEKIEVNPNSLEPIVIATITEDEKHAIRNKYNIPQNVKVFVYGGNLGKPQGVDFLLQSIEANTNEEVYFLIVGSGTEYQKMRNWFDNNKPENAKLLKGLPKVEYDQLLKSCDVGLIFLHPDFTIPNFPSRLLSYLEFKLPVIAATDKNTDIGRIAQENDFGFTLINGDLTSMIRYTSYFVKNENRIKEMGDNGYEFMLKNYDVNISYQTIVKHIENV